MRSGFRRLRPAAALTALLALFVAQGAEAIERDRVRGPRFEKAKRYIEMFFSRIGYPPG